MKALRRVRVTHGSSVIGEATLNEDGMVDIVVKDKVFFKQLFAVLERGEATSISIDPTIIAAVPANPKVETESHDDGTLNKVYAALADCELSYHKIIEAINSMQNAGILFRERV